MLCLCCACACLRMWGVFVCMCVSVSTSVVLMSLFKLNVCSCSGNGVSCPPCLDSSAWSQEFSKRFLCCLVLSPRVLAGLLGSQDGAIYGKHIFSYSCFCSYVLSISGKKCYLDGDFVTESWMLFLVLVS